jgi:hypothetical protein
MSLNRLIVVLSQEGYGEILLVSFSLQLTTLLAMAE